MLKLKHSHHLDFPHITFSGRQLEFSPLPADDDELTQAIEQDMIDRDNNWELSERPDMGELTRFWADVEADVANDPKWFSFAKDE